MAANDPYVRTLLSRIAGYERAAKAPDRAALTAAARKAAADRFERMVDPDGTMDPAERAKRAESLRKAFYLRMSLKGVQARQAKRAAARAATASRPLPHPAPGEAAAGTTPAGGPREPGAEPPRSVPGSATST